MQILVYVLVYCNFLREVRISGWGSGGPTLGQYVSTCATILKKKKYLISNLIIYFHFLTEWWRTHSMYWPNVGPFGPSLPQPPNLTSLRKLQYTNARTNVPHASIVVHAT